MFLKTVNVVGDVFPWIPDVTGFVVNPNISWLLLIVEFISSTTAPPES